MNGLLKALAKHKKLTLVTCIILLFGASPFLLGIIGIIWLMKLLKDMES